MSDSKPSNEQLQQSLSLAAGLAPAVNLTPPAAPVAAPASSSLQLDLGNVAAAVSSGAFQPAAQQVVVCDKFPYEVAFNMAFLGSGQGGARVATSFWGMGYRRVCVVQHCGVGLRGSAPRRSTGIRSSLVVLPRTPDSQKRRCEGRTRRSGICCSGPGETTWTTVWSAWVWVVVLAAGRAFRWSEWPHSIWRARASLLGSVSSRRFRLRLKGSRCAGMLSTHCSGSSR
jgi:hypothetical protein